MLKQLNLIAKIALSVVLMAGVTYAAKNVMKEKITPDLPGVTSDGNLDWENTSTGTGQVTYNTKTGRLVVTARGNVTNALKKAHVFQNAGVLASFVSEDSNIVRDRYSVNKKGRATYSGLARNVY